MTEDTAFQILFVCMGNICRSPTAEGVAAKMLAERGLANRVAVASAGTHGYHVGAVPDERTQAAAAARGYDLSCLRSRQVSSTDFHRYDLVLAMDDANYDDLQTFQAHHGGHATLRRLLDFAGGGAVPDPYYGAGDGFERVLDAVEEGCRGLIAAIESGQLAGRS